MAKNLSIHGCIALALVAAACATQPTGPGSASSAGSGGAGGASSSSAASGSAGAGGKDIPDGGGEGGWIEQADAGPDADAGCPGAPNPGTGVCVDPTTDCPVLLPDVDACWGWTCFNGYCVAVPKA